MIDSNWRNGTTDHGTITRTRTGRNDGHRQTNTLLTGAPAISTTRADASARTYQENHTPVFLSPFIRSDVLRNDTHVAPLSPPPPSPRLTEAKNSKLSLSIKLATSTWPPQLTKERHQGAKPQPTDAATTVEHQSQAAETTRTAEQQLQTTVEAEATLTQQVYPARAEGNHDERKQGCRHDGNHSQGTRQGLRTTGPDDHAPLNKTTEGNHPIVSQPTRHTAGNLPPSARNTRPETTEHRRSPRYGSNTRKARSRSQAVQALPAKPICTLCGSQRKTARQGNSSPAETYTNI